jgi:hypothetical protein
MDQLHALVSSDIVNPMCIQQPREWILAPIQNTVGTYKQLIILIPYQDTSRLLTLLEFNYAFIQVCDGFILFVSSPLILSSRDSPFSFNPESYFHVLQCSDYLHLFDLAPATTAI